MLEVDASQLGGNIPTHLSQLVVIRPLEIFKTTLPVMQQTRILGLPLLQQRAQRVFALLKEGLGVFAQYL